MQLPEFPLNRGPNPAPGPPGSGINIGGAILSGVAEY
jgi:hypothetical protein